MILVFFFFSFFMIKQGMELCFFMNLEQSMFVLERIADNWDHLAHYREFLGNIG